MGALVPYISDMWRKESGGIKRKRKEDNVSTSLYAKTQSPKKKHMDNFITLFFFLNEAFPN